MSLYVYECLWPHRVGRKCVLCLCAHVCLSPGVLCGFLGAFLSLCWPRALFVCMYACVPTDPVCDSLHPCPGLPRLWPLPSPVPHAPASVPPHCRAVNDSTQVR